MLLASSIAAIFRRRSPPVSSAGDRGNPPRGYGVYGTKSKRGIRSFGRALTDTHKITKIPYPPNRRGGRVVKYRRVACLKISNPPIKLKPVPSRNFHMSKSETGFDPTLFKQIHADPRPRSNPHAEIQRDTANALKGIVPTYNKQLITGPYTDEVPTRTGHERDPNFESNLIERE